MIFPMLNMLQNLSFEIKAFNIQKKPVFTGFRLNNVPVPYNVYEAVHVTDGCLVFQGIPYIW